MKTDETPGKTEDGLDQVPEEEKAAEKEADWPDAVAQADDGYGPYLPILAVTGKEDENGPELIPGKYCTVQKRAFWSSGGREHEADEWKVVKGKLYPAGTRPKKSDAVGFQTHCPKTPWYGAHYIGICKIKETVWGPGKVKDGVLYYGYGGTEHQTRDFRYVKVTHIDDKPVTEVKKG